MKLVARRGTPAARATRDGRPRGLRNRVRGIPIEDLLVHLPQCRAGVGTQLLDEPLTHRAIGLQRLGLPAAAELGNHQLPGQAFVQGVVVLHRGDVQQQFAVASGAQTGVIAVEGYREPLSLPRGADIVNPRGVERRERITAPQRQCFSEQCVGFGRIRGSAGLACQLTEAMQIDRCRIDRQHISARLAGDFNVIARDHLSKPG